LDVKMLVIVLFCFVKSLAFEYKFEVQGVSTLLLFSLPNIRFVP